MSAKEVKTYLKDARDLVKSKEFPKAIKICNEVIKLDNKNHMGYILLGACHQSTNKSEAARYLRIALDLSDDKLLALQGLSNCAEPHELPDIYEKLLGLMSEKYHDLHQKIQILAEQLIDPSPCILILGKETNVENEKRVNSALACLLNIFLKFKDIGRNFKNEYLKALKHGIQNRYHIQHIDIYQSYFKFLHQNGDFKTLLKAADIMIEIYDKQISPLEWICKVFVEKHQELENNILKSDIGEYIGKLLEMNSTSVFGLMARGAHKYQLEDYVGARDVLLKVNSLQPNWNICLKLLGEIHLKFRAYLLAEIIFRQLKDCKLELAEALIEQKTSDDKDEGLEICNELIKSESDTAKQIKIQVLIAKHLIIDKRYDEVSIHIQKLENLGASEEQLVLLKAVLLRSQKENIKALDLLKPFGDSHLCNLEIGKIYFDLKKYEDSLQYILKATKLQPYSSDCFNLLGEIYMEFNDEIRCKKCFEKCLYLNPQNNRAMIHLNVMYREGKEFDANLVMLENAINSVEGAYQKTALLQLGFHHLSTRDYDKAIAAFRSTLKYDINNSSCWEGLADSYLARGSYTSALKVFEKTCELNLENNYAKAQIARIQFILQQFSESIESYMKLLQKIPNYLPALKGIAETHLGKARNLFEQRLVGRSRDHAQAAIPFLEKAIKENPEFLCLWRLLANVLDFAAQLPSTYSFLEVSGSLLKEQATSKVIRDDALFELSAKCYCRCLKICKDDEYIWFDLVSNYYFRAMKCGKDEKVKLEHLQLALESAKHLVKLFPGRWNNWNLLGIVAASNEINNPALAQHCFIKAVTIDKMSYTSWSNLGVFYLTQGNIKLANKAFGRAQQFDTTFLNAWIGQAFIAELIGEKDEAMDLFRHCTHLGYHSDAALGYANFVCSVLNEEDYAKLPKYEYAIDKMHGKALALDSIDWYANAETSETSFEAYSYLGYLNSTEGMLQKAVEAYRKAVGKCDGLKKDQSLTDLGYSLMKIEKHEEAIQSFSQIQQQTFSSIVGLALAQFKAQKYQESYGSYQKAVEWMATTDQEKAQVLVAMSAMVYAFQGAEGAKVLLFQCIGLPNPPMEGLFSTCALSLLHNDKQLCDLTIRELQKHESNPSFGHHVNFLIVQFYVKSNNKQKALTYILSQIHRYPDRPLVRKILVDLVLQEFKTNKNLMMGASQVAQSTILLRFNNPKTKSSSEDASKALAVASEAMRFVDQKARKILAQKAVHCNPNCKEAWSSLVVLLKV